MPSLPEAVKAIIDAIPDSATMFPGGVWTRPILPEDSTGPDGILWASTPEAFDPMMPIQIMRCLSINQPNRVTSGTNWMDQYYDYFECWYYGPDTPADRAALSESMEAIREVFKNKPVAYDSGVNKVMPSNDRAAIRPTGEFFHAVFGMERFVVVSHDII
jgi:hypothetical protein